MIATLIVNRQDGSEDTRIQLSDVQLAMLLDGLIYRFQIAVDNSKDNKERMALIRFIAGEAK